jgi:protein ImuB
VQLPEPVLAMRLIARDLPAFVPRGRDLFDERPANALPIEQLRERLRARLGDRAVHRLAGTTDPRPERAQIVSESGAAYDEPHPRPTWLLDRPIPLRGPPPRVLAGPERLETGWWDGAEACRDYYVVETSLGQHAWAFCQPGEQSGWMLQGWFA